MNQETKVLIGIGLATVAVFAGIIFYHNSSTTSNATAVDAATLLSEDAVQSGPANAKLTLVEFADFQCPACGAEHSILQQLRKDYGDKLNFVYRYFPLETIHKNALISAQAAEAARAQGKFWEMHDQLFEHQDQWSESDKPMDFFITYAKNIGLDEAKFTDSVNKKEFESKIRDAESKASQLGIDRTPTFYLNGKAIDGIPTYQEFKTKFETELEK